jgi:hypothetical protein
LNSAPYFPGAAYQNGALQLVERHAGPVPIRRQNKSRMSHAFAGFFRPGKARSESQARQSAGSFDRYDVGMFGSEPK